MVRRTEMVIGGRTIKMDKEIIEKLNQEDRNEYKLDLLKEDNRDVGQFILNFMALFFVVDYCSEWV